MIEPAPESTPRTGLLKVIGSPKSTSMLADTSWFDELVLKLAVKVVVCPVTIVLGLAVCLRSKRGSVVTVPSPDEVVMPTVSQPRVFALAACGSALQPHQLFVAVMSPGPPCLTPSPRPPDATLPRKREN